MFIKLTVVSYYTTGTGPTLRCTHHQTYDEWVNKDKILSFRVEPNTPDSFPYDQLTRVYLGSGHFTVAETPEEIVRLSK